MGTFLASRTHLKFLASKPQDLENCPVLGSRTTLFFEPLKFVGKRQKPRRKFANTFFVFLNWSIGVAKEGGTRKPAPLPIEISPITRMCQKSLLFLQFQFLFSIFHLQQ